MQIPIPENLNPDLIMRRSGYGFLSDRRSGQNSYVRRMGNGFYPRFHVYLEDGTFINLELVQEGYADVDTFPPDVRYADVFTSAARVAREAGVGLWSECK